MGLNALGGAALDAEQVALRVSHRHPARAVGLTVILILGRAGHYLLTVKANTPALRAAVRTALAEINPVTSPPDHVDEQHLRGQIYRRSLWAVAVLAGDD